MKKKLTPIKLGMTLYKLGCYTGAETRVSEVTLKWSPDNSSRTFFEIKLDGYLSRLQGSFPDEERELTVETAHISDMYTADRSVWLESAIKALEKELVEKNELYNTLCNEVILK